MFLCACMKNKLFIEWLLFLQSLYFFKDYDFDDEDDGYSYLSFNVPKDLARDFINNKKEVYKFRYCDQWSAF